MALSLHLVHVSVLWESRSEKGKDTEWTDQTISIHAIYKINIISSKQFVLFFFFFILSKFWFSPFLNFRTAIVNQYRNGTQTGPLSRAQPDIGHWGCGPRETYLYLYAT